MRVLVTGGAGFIGSRLCIRLGERHPDWEVVSADNLFRRGSDLNVPRLRAAGIEFAHADVRQPADLDRLGRFDAIVEAAAEPAVSADRRDGGRRLLVDTNLLGAVNCLELAARDGSHFIALSTSRVYPVGALERLRMTRGETRFELDETQDVPGASAAGISERFPLDGARSLYGATKLAGEMLAGEYAHSLGLPVTINRCGVIAGPWQLATSEQGVFTHWALSYVRRRPLAYIGYGGDGRQVRDLLHVEDLINLVELQLGDPEAWSGVTVNVGGGLQGSLSLREASAICAELTGNEIDVRSVDGKRPDDVPLYLSDCARLHALCDWRPQRSPRQTLADTIAWLQGDSDVAATL